MSKPLQSDFATLLDQIDVARPFEAAKLAQEAASLAEVVKRQMEAADASRALRDATFSFARLIEPMSKVAEGNIVTIAHIDDLPAESRMIDDLNAASSASLIANVTLSDELAARQAEFVAMIDGLGAKLGSAALMASAALGAPAAEYAEMIKELSAQAGSAGQTATAALAAAQAEYAKMINELSTQAGSPGLIANATLIDEIAGRNATFVATIDNLLVELGKVADVDELRKMIVWQGEVENLVKSVVAEDDKIRDYGR